MKRILLVGRAGNGLTSCVQSINKVQPGCRPIEIYALECPGVGDKGEDRRESIESTRNNLKEIIKAYDKDGGIDAIALVLKYGVRFTKQEKDAVEEVKLMFGANVFQEHGIIIMTYGDLFEGYDVGKENYFIDWASEQRGDIEKLFQDVQTRVYLFDNKADNIQKRREQVEHLSQCFMHFRKPYTLEDFEKASQLDIDSIFGQANPKCQFLLCLQKHFKIIMGFLFLFFILCLIILFCDLYVIK
ncbi:protein AIG1 [Biomphalaria pfeifferi]|uniref:Protein AIG1 n=1 Tax=Biomphalaria pfeifferi TaxID=112525 RepID=A0AAD8B8R1_BIOPF|nr:protein AIG1 [Biomphalaria pfeifferi]